MRGRVYSQNGIELMAGGAPLAVEMLRWVEYVHRLEYERHAVPRRTGAVAVALAMLDRELPMNSRDISRFARMGHETVRRGADALFELDLVDRHRRPRLDMVPPGLAPPGDQSSSRGF